MDVFVELKATISQFQAKMAEARGEMSKTEAHGSSTFANLSKFGGAAAAGIAGAAVAVGAVAVKMGNDLEDARAKADAALKGTGQSFDQLAGPIGNTEKLMEKFGFTNAQTLDALAAGTVATGSGSKALSLMSTAANLAVFKHIDLATAMTAVARASEGQTRPLAQLGIIVPALSVSGSTLKTAQDNLAKAQVALTAAQAADHPTAAQVVADRLAAAKNALALEKANDAVTAAQQNVNAVVKQYPDAANGASKGHALLVDANRKLSEAQQAAVIVAQSHAAVLNNTSPHAKYEAAVQKVADAQAKLNELHSSGGTIVDVLNKKLGGQAAAAADTFSGKIAAAKAQLSDMAAQLGLKLIPLIEKTVEVTTDIVNWFGKHKLAAEALAGVIGGALSLAIGAFTVNKLAGMVKGIGSAAGALKDLGGKMLGLGGGGIDSVGKTAASSLDGAAGKLEAAAGKITAAAEKLAGAGSTAGSEIEGGAAAAKGELAAGGATAETEMAAGGATAEAEESLGGKLAGAAMSAGLVLAAAAVAEQFANKLPGAKNVPQADVGVEKVTSKIPILGGLGNDIGNSILHGIGAGDQAQLSKQQIAAYTVTGLNGQPLQDLAPQSIPHRAGGGPVAAGQWAMVGENGPELAQFGMPATIYPNGTRPSNAGPPVVHVTIQNLNLPNVANTDQFIAAIQQQARLAAMSGNTRAGVG